MCVYVRAHAFSPFSFLVPSFPLWSIFADLSINYRYCRVEDCFESDLYYQVSCSSIDSFEIVLPCFEWVLLSLSFFVILYHSHLAANYMHMQLRLTDEDMKRNFHSFSAQCKNTFLGKENVGYILVVVSNLISLFLNLPCLFLFDPLSRGASCLNAYDALYRSCSRGVN
jgi:hypothetical protein